MKRVRLSKLTKPYIRNQKKDRPRVKDGPGKPEFVPTEDDRRLVRLMRSNMVSQKEMCKMIYNPQTGSPISPLTLVKCFSKELEQAEIEAKMRVSSALMTLAVGKDLEMLEIPDTRPKAAQGAKRIIVQMPKAPDLGAIVWWEKTRCGYTDAVRVDGDQQAQQVVVILPPNHRDQPYSKTIEHQAAPQPQPKVEVKMPRRANGAAS